MKKFSLGFFLIGALLLSAGCEDRSGRAEVVLEKGLEPVWKDLSATKNFPADFVLPLGKKGSGNFKLTLLSVSWQDAFSRVGAAKAAAPEALAEKTVRLDYYAPAVFFLEPKTDIRLDEILSKKTEPIPVKLLRDIRLPQKALRVSGLLPGDEAYPLVSRLVLRLEGEGPEKSRNKLFTWLECLPPPEPAKVASLAAVGDVMPGRGSDAILLASPRGKETVFGDVLPLMKKSDLLLGNLEGAVTVRGEKFVKAYNFRFPPTILDALVSSGFGYLALTNNHVYDFGDQGLLDTLDAFKAAGLPTSGAGRDLAEACRPWEKTVRGTRVRVLSLGAYPAEGTKFDGRLQAAAGENRPGILWAGETALAAMRKGFSADTFDLVLVHGGEEWHSEPAAEQKALYRSFVDAGADIVIGSHPHVLQGAEVYRGKLIAYSLGNFLFPGMDETRYGEESVLLSLGIHEGEVRYVEFHPVRLRNQVLGLDRSGEILKRFLGLCREFKR